jgi:glycosyltransferase involved in cell wall biosynthesis
MKMSVLVSAYNRGYALDRLLRSVLLDQGHDDIQLVIVDDCSRDNTEEVIQNWLLAGHKDKIIYLKNEVRSERVISYRRALENATGDWLIHIGSDDQLFPRFTEFFMVWTEKYPDTKLFNFGRGAINKHNWRITTAPGQAFKMGQEFNSGLIAAGQFAWHKDISHQINFPVVRDCYAFADESKIPITGMKDEEGNQKYYSRYTRTLGNPWGEDFYMFWKLTRENEPVHIPIIGILINVR